MLAQPAQGLVFELLGNRDDLNVAILSFDGVQEVDCPAVPELATDRGPGLAADMAGGDYAPAGESLQEPQGSNVMRVSFVRARDEERGIGKDQGSGFDGP